MPFLRVTSLTSLPFEKYCVTPVYPVSGAFEVLVESAPCDEDLLFDLFEHPEVNARKSRIINMEMLIVLNV
jgi:hypothetical protein